jgi:hypothetical protein
VIRRRSIYPAIDDGTGNGKVLTAMPNLVTLNDKPKNEVLAAAKP